MADMDGAAAISDAESNAALNGLADSLSENLNENFDGLHEAVIDNAKETKLINETQAELVKLVSQLCDNTDPANQESDSDDALNDIGAALDAQVSGKGDEEKGLKGKGKLVEKPDQLFKLPECYSLPAILLWSKLDSIEKKMGDGKDDKKKKGGGGGIGNLFKGLLEGAAGILILAVALIIFAGALVMFGIIDWGSALLGMLSFTLFVLGSILLAKQVAKEKKTFVEFALGILLLTVALILFIVALKVCGLVTIGDIIKGVLVLAMFFVFVAAVVFLGNFVNASKNAFINLGIGAILLAVALALFALALMVCGLLTAEQIVKGIIVAGLMLLFVAAFAAIGMGMLPVLPFIISMAVGTLILIAGIMLFAVAMMVCGLLTAEQIMKGIVVAGLMLLFILAFSLIGAAVWPIIPLLLLFAVASILLSVGLMLFALAIDISVKLLTPEKLQAFIQLLPGMGIIFLSMIVVGTLALVAVVLLAGFVAASALLLVGFLLFSLAMLAMKLVWLTFVLLGVAGVAVTIAGMLAVFVGMIVIGTAALVAIVFIAGFMAASILMAIGFLAFAASVAALGEIHKTFTQMGVKGIMDSLSNITTIFGMMIPIGIASVMAVIPIGAFTVAAVLLAKGILSILDVVNAMEIIGQKTPAVLAKEPGAKPPSIQAIDDIFKAVAKVSIGPAVMLKILGLAYSAGVLASVFKDCLVIFRAITTVEDKMTELKDKGVEFSTLMDPFKQIFVCVADAAEGFSGMSKKAAQSMAIAIVPMTQAIDNLAHTVVYLADFALDPQMEEKMDAAKMMFARILTDFFGAGGEPAEGTVLHMMNNMQGVGKDVGRAAEALVPVTEAIGNVTDIIIKTAEMEDPATGIAKLREVVGFCSELNTFAASFTGEADGLIGKGLTVLIGKQDSVTKFNTAKESIDAMGPMIEAIKNVVNGIGQMEDTSAQREKIITLMGFCEELNSFACIFTGKPTGAKAAVAWLIGSKDSATQYKDAADAITAMNPMLDAIKSLSQNLNSLEDVAISLQTLEQVFALANPEDLAGKGEKLKAFAKSVKEANGLLPSQNKLANFFDDLSAALTKGDFGKIDKVAEGATKLAAAINKMNSELTRLRNENSQTMKDVSNMNKGSGNPLSGAISSIGSMIKKDGGGSGSGADYSEILSSIADNVKTIAENTAPEQESLFGLRKS
jgi:hypothetical protein